MVAAAATAAINQKEQINNNINMAPSSHVPPNPMTTTTTVMISPRASRSAAPIPVTVPTDLNASHERGWKTTLINKSAIPDSFDVLITTITRTAPPAVGHIPDKFYSSLIYKIQHLSFGFANAKNIDKLIARVQTIDPETKDEILKNRQPIMRGSTEIQMTRGSTGEFEGMMKIQFTDVSYHHGNKEFAWRMCYYLPHDTEHPILVKESAPFFTMARKPTPNDHITQAKRNRKRKGLLDEADEGELTTTISKTEAIEPRPTAFGTTMAAPPPPATTTTTTAQPTLTTTTATTPGRKKKAPRPSLSTTTISDDSTLPTINVGLTPNLPLPGTNFNVMQRNLEEIYNQIDNLSNEQKQEIMDMLMTKLIPKLTSSELNNFLVPDQATPTTAPMTNYFFAPSAGFNGNGGGGGGGNTGFGSFEDKFVQFDFTSSSSSGQAGQVPSSSTITSFNNNNNNNNNNGRQDVLEFLL